MNLTKYRVSRSQYINNYDFINIKYENRQNTKTGKTTLFIRSQVVLSLLEEVIKTT